MSERLIYGRQLLKNELPFELVQQLEHSNNANTLHIQTQSGFNEDRKKWFCRRCKSEVKPMKPSYCQCSLEECGYCTNCIQMGKVKRCSTFYWLPEPNQFPRVENTLAWGGTLSDQQSQAADDIIHSINHKETRLIWAVAGAGKTEMLFKGIALSLERGYRIGIASPRVDVCLELYPRLQQAFPKIPISLLYGGVDEPYEYTQLTIATTHQLMRFKEAFDLLIIDEIDAFPFDVEKTLQTAAKQSRKTESTLIYLSATPNYEMQKQIKHKKLKASILPARYHGHPLPVPKISSLSNWKKKLLQKDTPSKLYQHMDHLLSKKKRFLIFIPNIKWCREWEKVMRQKYNKYQFECVHSRDEDRKEKVLLMRKESLDFLITTTILERGVTFKDIDVIVVGADDGIFTESSLVQISGRVGRSPQFPTGNITFYYEEISLSMKRAIKQIKRMNKMAKKRGLLHGKS
ncbi:MAG TPA: DEAD/DEAH box helicase [Alloiococcus sp.]|nr:DEAD/DEAH box helicase [Alloiococcus sp.]